MGGSQIEVAQAGAGRLSALGPVFGRIEAGLARAREEGVSAFLWTGTPATCRSTAARAFAWSRTSTRPGAAPISGSCAATHRAEKGMLQGFAGTAEPRVAR